VNVLFSDAFAKSLRKHASLKEIVRKKVDMVVQDPVRFGEPLKGNLRGFYSCPVKRNFLVIYLYCRACRKKGDDKSVLCGDCAHSEDETIRFVELGPHDQAYTKMQQ
jgi:mRNA-degrading endonuclease YafQ of YafQ-DinJ toxin-antitoxin module